MLDSALEASHSNGALAGLTRTLTRCRRRSGRAGLPAPLSHTGRDSRPARRGGGPWGLRRWGRSRSFSTPGTSSAPFLIHVSGSRPAPSGGSPAEEASGGWKLRRRQQSWTELVGNFFHPHLRTPLSLRCKEGGRERGGGERGTLMGERTGCLSQAPTAGVQPAAFRLRDAAPRDGAAG